MGDFTVKILKNGDIDELIERYPKLDILKNKRIDQAEKFRWIIGEKVVYNFQIIFLGKTGYGKSTTINKLIGEYLFETDDFNSCTKELYTAEYQLNTFDDRYFFSIGDLPGIGESVGADRLYLESYRNFLSKSSIVVYLLRADQRDFAIDLDIFESLFSTWQEKDKVIIGLNFIDKIEPVNRQSPFKLSFQQQQNLHAKVNYVSSLFGIETNRISCFSSTEAFNLDDLVANVARRVTVNIARGVIR